ncbi:MAG: hypothetical protein WA017_18410 [Desulfosalsimonadaceae bacterium]
MCNLIGLSRTRWAIKDEILSGLNWTPGFFGHMFHFISLFRLILGWRVASVNFFDHASHRRLFTKEKRYSSHDPVWVSFIKVNAEILLECWSGGKIAGNATGPAETISISLYWAILEKEVFPHPFPAVIPVINKSIRIYSSQYATDEKGGLIENGPAFFIVKSGLHFRIQKIIQAIGIGF